MIENMEAFICACILAAVVVIVAFLKGFSGS